MMLENLFAQAHFGAFTALQGVVMTLGKALMD